MPGAYIIRELDAENLRRMALEMRDEARADRLASREAKGHMADMLRANANVLENWANQLDAAMDATRPATL